MNRRRLLRAMGLGSVLTLGGRLAVPAVAKDSPAPAPRAVASAGAKVRRLGYAFGTEKPSVTVFDVETLQVIDSRPIDATVRWLSNEQQFWDGRYIWTYDFPDNVVQAVAIDPRTAAVVRKISTGGEGPAHSLMLTDDGATAWINVAGADHLAVIDTSSGQVLDRVETGHFP